MAGVKEIKPEGFNESSPKPGGIPLVAPGSIRKRNVTGENGQAYVLFEIPYEKSTRFMAELDKNTANPQTTMSGLKWFWIYNFKGQIVGEWTGEAAKTYEEATGQPDKYNIGKKYIQSQYALVGAQKLKPGRAFWMEAFSLRPELKSPVGAFVVMVAEKPIVVEINAEKPLSKCGCSGDQPTEYRYGELLKVQLLIHELRGQHTVIVEVKSKDGKQLGRQVLTALVPEKLEETNNFIGVNYNFTGEVNFILDNKWKEMLGHQQGQTKEFVVHVGVWENLTEGKPLARFATQPVASSTHVSPVKMMPKQISQRDSSVLTLLYDTDEVAMARQEQSNQVAKIGVSAVKTICYADCKYEAIHIEEIVPGAKEEAAKEKKTEYDNRKFVMLEERADAATGPRKVLHDFTHMTYNIVAGGDKGQKEITITLAEVQVNDKVCINNPKHTGKVFNTEKIEEAIEQEKKQPVVGDGNLFMKIYDSGKHTTTVSGTSSTSKNKTEQKPGFVILNGNTDEIFKFKAAYQYGDMDSLSYLFSLWNPAKAKHKLYPLLVQSCRYQRPVTFAVYPDIKWAINIKFNFENLGWFEQKKWYKASKYKMTAAVFQETTINLNSPEFQVVGVQRSVGMVIQENSREERKIKREDFDPANSKKLRPGRSIWDVGKEIELGLEAQWNGGDKKVEVTEKFLKDVYSKFKIGFEIYKEVARILKGQGTPKETLDEKQKTVFEKFKKGLTRERKKLSFEFTPPSIAASLGWGLSEENNSKDPSLNNLNSLVLDYALEFSPIFGASIKLDLIALVQNAHPIAYVVVKLVDFAAAMGDAEIIAEIKLSGDINLKGSGTKNLMTGANTMTNKQYLQDTKAKPLEGDVKIELTVTLKFKKDKTYDAFVYKVIVSGEVSAEAKTFVKLGAAVQADEQGLHIAWEFVFGGLKLDVVAKFSVKGESRGRKRERPDDKPKQDSFIDVGDKWSFVLLKESTWPMGKWYFDSPDKQATPAAAAPQPAGAAGKTNRVNGGASGTW